MRDLTTSVRNDPPPSPGWTEWLGRPERPGLGRQAVRVSAAVIWVALVLGAGATLLPGCAGRSHRPGAVATVGNPAEPPREQVVQVIALAGDLSRRSAEVSGLAWFGNYLVLLPQYPDRFPHEDYPVAPGTIFAIEKQTILDYLDGKRGQPILPHRVAFFSGGLEASIPGYNGFEALAFRGARAYLTIESRSDSLMHGFMVTGRMMPDLSWLRVRDDHLVEIPPQTNIGNLSEETLLVAGQKILALSEANGANVNPNPVAHQFDPVLRPLGSIPIPTVEFRITDATAIDREGCFWIINYFYPGEREKLLPGKDFWAARFGKGASHARCQTVERLVELRYTEQAIVRTQTPPIQLQLLGVKTCRNWEGLARLDDRGFLIITDQYPRTIFGFVALP